MVCATVDVSLCSEYIERQILRETLLTYTKSATATEIIWYRMSHIESVKTIERKRDG